MKNNNSKIKSLDEWERENFEGSAREEDISVIFPSREIYFSSSVLNLMRLNNLTCPRTLDQWYELWYPGDHSKLAKFERNLYGPENFFSVTRKLYCGDGLYRNFRIDAFIQRDSNGRPLKLFARENLALSAWLEQANEGDKISFDSKNFEAVRVGGLMTLRDLTLIEDLELENQNLRHEIQRRIFSSNPEDFDFNNSSDGRGEFLSGLLEKNLADALEVMPDSNQLKTLRHSLHEKNINVGILGLAGSGKTTLINSILGEKILSEEIFSDVPVFCTEGPEKIIKIFYQDGRTEITQAINKNNKDSIARIEISQPGALIPQGLCLVDTPGYDSLSGASPAVLRNLLPELDFIVYVTPVRARLKGSDFEYLKLILNLNVNIIFLLSQVDLERDDSEAGKIIFSLDEKISRDINSIKEDSKKISRRDFEVIPVSAREALKNFSDKNSTGWKNSNLESFLKYLSHLTNNFFVRVMTLRTQRALKILEAMPFNWKLHKIIMTLKKNLEYNCFKVPAISTGYEFSAKNIIEEPAKKNLLSSLINSMREREFNQKFFSLKAFRTNRNAIFLSADKNMSMKLFARLAHKIKMESLPDGGKISEHEWFCTSENAPFNSIKLTSSAFKNGNEKILIAPPDYFFLEHEKDTAINWTALFKKFVPVVSVDLARIDSGLSDLAYAPYIVGLAVSKWVLVFGNAAMFDKRQIELVSSIPERVKYFVEVNGLKKPDWFIFENYKIF